MVTDRQIRQINEELNQELRQKRCAFCGVYGDPKEFVRVDTKDFSGNVITVDGCMDFNACYERGGGVRPLY